MASEAGPGEGWAALGGWEDSGLPSGPLEGECPGRPGELPPECCSDEPWAGQATGGAQGKDETPEGDAILCEVLREESGPRDERAEAREEEEVVVVEDIMEEVEVVTTGDMQEQENAEEQEQRPQAQPKQAQPPPGPCNIWRSLKALEALQLEMEPVNTWASRAYFRLRRMLGQSCKQHLDRRNAIIQSIPGFWVKAIVNHPQMSAMISEEDEDMLSYMINLEVENFIHPNNRCKITFSFRSNPYFQNELIIQEYDINITGYTASSSTPVQWFHDYEREAYSRRPHDNRLFFFNWFSSPSFTGHNRIAEIITEDLWINPLKYYLREEGSRRGSGEENRASPSLWHEHGGSSNST